VLNYPVILGSRDCDFDNATNGSGAWGFSPQFSRHYQVAGSAPISSCVPELFPDGIVPQSNATVVLPAAGWLFCQSFGSAALIAYMNASWGFYYA